SRSDPSWAEWVCARLQRCGNIEVSAVSCVCTGYGSPGLVATSPDRHATVWLTPDMGLDTIMSFERLRMKRLLHDQSEQPVPRAEASGPCRPVTADDIPALAQLVLDAYAGTIDDEGETLDEALRAIHDTFAGTSTSGRLLPMCSFVIEEGGRALACTL